jgi:DNA-binding transcriptional regulator LsrR (DeoR family)
MSAMAAEPRPRRRLARTAPDEHLRLMTKVARLYHEHGVRQPEIARRLHISQARVSRLLKSAQEAGIVRTIIVVPEGVQTELEEALEQRYGLRDAIVVDCFDDSDDGVIYDLGVAAAGYLEATMTGGDVVGISSWSSTLLAAVDAMRPLPRASAERAIQLFGGVGNPAAEEHAARLTQRFAELTHARPTFLLAPGIAASREVRDALLQDQFVVAALNELDNVTLALVGIGSLEPSTLLQSSGNIVPEAELAELGKLGAVGDICLRFFDAEGRHVPSEVDKRVIGVTLDQLRNVDRCVGIAGGPRKYEAIRGALLGGLVNVLITDHVSAERLVADEVRLAS